MSYTVWVGSVDNRMVSPAVGWHPEAQMPPTSAALSAKLIFPTKEIVEEYYLPIIYTACRTCYSELVPDQIWDKAVSRQVADEKQQNLVRSEERRVGQGRTS